MMAATGTRMALPLPRGTDRSVALFRTEQRNRGSLSILAAGTSCLIAGFRAGHVPPD